MAFGLTSISMDITTRNVLFLYDIDNFNVRYCPNSLKSRNFALVYKSTYKECITKKKDYATELQSMAQPFAALISVHGGVCKAQTGTEKGAVLSGSDVYVSTTNESYRINYSLLGNAKISFKVITTTDDKSTLGAVSVQPASSNTDFSGASLTIPSVIYNKKSNKYYPYAVTTIPDNAFKGTTGIKDLLFSYDKNNTLANGYQVKTIGSNAFYGITTLTGTIQLPRTITSIGDNAFALPSSSAGTIENVVMGANSVKHTTLSFGKNVFDNRTITNLHVLGNFSYATYAGDQTFNNTNVTNLYYYGDGTTSSKPKGDGDEGYYNYLSTTLTDHTSFTPIGQNLYIPGDDVMNFVKLCKDKHPDWIPATVNCLTFDKTTDDGSTYTLMLKSSNTKDGGYELALHGAKLNPSVTTLTFDFSTLNIDILPTTSSLIGHVVQIDSKAFAGNDNLQSITLSSSESCELMGNAFQGLPSLRVLDISDKRLTTTTGYTLSRIPTTDYDETIAYKYTKDGGKYEYEYSDKTPFGGLPAYTLVFLPKSITSYPSTTTTSPEKVYKYKADGATAHDTWKRPVDENYMLWNDDKQNWYCNNFGVYDVPELNPSTVSGQKYSGYAWSTPSYFLAKKSTFYRDFEAGVPSSVCLPFAPDPTKDATFYTYDSTDGSSVTLKSVDTPEANTPYFIRPNANMKLTSTKEQTITNPTTTIIDASNMHGVYAGQSMSEITNAYGMAGSEFKYNGTKYPAGTFMKLSSSAYINPFRAYLTVSSTSAKFLRLVVNDTPTGIALPNLQENKATPYYNLQGMKTAQPSHGIYIHNGRKVIVK